MKDFADNNSKFEENGRKLSKPVENTVGKGEIARYEQFLLFPQCFQKVCFPGASKGVIVWEWINYLPKDIILDQLKIKAQADDKIYVTKKLKFVFRWVENILGKGEIFPLPTMFSKGFLYRVVTRHDCVGKGSLRDFRVKKMQLIKMRGNQSEHEMMIKNSNASTVKKKQREREHENQY